jgi:hypothetical protein
MASEELLSAVDDDGPFTNPWPALVTALCATGLGFLLSAFLRDTGLVVCGLLAFAGVLAAGAAVAIQPRSWVVLLLAALVALMASMVAETADWDSAGTLLRILMAIAGVSALVVLLPPAGRRVVVSLVILFHFGGILSATTNIQPGPWVSAQLWTYIYRPYLQFMYMNNAYHYYSPDPGPASLLWFRIEYETTEEPDGHGGMKTWKHSRWVKIPEVDETGARVRPGRDKKRYWPAVEYTRRLSIAESINQGAGAASQFAESKRRAYAGIVPILPMSESQYREPNTLSKHWLASYIRHVAKSFPYEDQPELRVTGVKAYLVIHRILQPWEFAAGADPNDMVTYMPYYMGEYETNGKLKKTSQDIVYDKIDYSRPNPSRTDDNGLPAGGSKEMDRDPLLYWYIPIYRKLKRDAKDPNPPALTDKNSKLVNWLDYQSGDKDRPPREDDE